MRAIREAGVAEGDAVMIHSSMTGFEGFTGTVADIVAAFKEAVGPQGTILMPALSMSGSALEFARSGRVFDARTTPSQSGVITEVFRRSAEVSRSVHPTHSISVWGRDRDWWVKDHHLASTPCGRGTPFDRLLERDGKIALAGTGIAALTFFHYAEEILEDKMPFSPFTRETFTMPCRVSGALLNTAPMRLYEPSVSRRRTLQPLEQELRAGGMWREGRAGTLTLIGLQAKDIMTALERMTARGVFCYKANEAA
jgi:aminoglycoside N3'-acetyltransferase